MFIESPTICLSGTSSERYRRDILRVLAMPKGCHLQFRYAKDWVSAPLWDLVSYGLTHSLPAIIAFWSASADSREVIFVPCRSASIIRATKLGSVATLTLRLDSFSATNDAQVFTEEIRRLSANQLPIQETTGVSLGKLWSELSAFPDSIRPEDSGDYINDWQDIVTQLAREPSFAMEPTFYTVLGLKQLGKSLWLKPSNATYSLRPNRYYELHIHHYHPDSDFGDGQPHVELSIAIQGNAAQLTSNQSLFLDSPYDTKCWRFRTAEPQRNELSVLTLCREVIGSTDRMQPTNPDLELTINVRRNYVKLSLLGLVIGILLTIPHILSSISSPAISTSWTLALTAISCLIAGLIAAFKLTNPL